MNRLILLMLTIVFLFSCKKDSETKPLNENADNLEVKDTSQGKELRKTYKKPIRQVKAELAAKGFDFFEYIDEITNDTIIMQQYFMVFLKSGPIRSQNEEETRLLENQHLAHLANMYELGYTDISGPFTDKGNIRSISIYNVPTLKMADSLAKSDPMVKNGNLIVEVHPWWAAKGHALR